MAAYLPSVLLTLLLLRLLLAGFPQFAVEYDMAALELYTRNVFHGGQLLGAYSRLLFHHPGPLMFYAYAPLYELSGHSFSALLVMALAINALAVWTLLRLVSLSTPRSLWTATFTIGVTAYLVYLEPDVLCSAWNPHVSILPFGVVLVASASLLAGRASAALALVVAGSFVLQAHLGYLVPLSLLAGVVVAALLLPRQAAHLGLAPPAAGASKKPFMWATIVGVILWAPVIAEQILGRPGNLTRIAEFVTRRGDGHPLGEALGTTANWVGGFLLSPAGVNSRTVLSQNEAVWARAGCALLIVGLGLAWWVGRRSKIPFAASLAIITSLSLIGAVVAAATVTGPLSDYLLRWASVNGPLAAGLGLGALATLRPGTRDSTEGASGRAWGQAGLVVVVCALAVLLLLRILRFTDLRDVARQPHYERMARLAGDVSAALDKQGIVQPIVRSTTNDCLSDVAGVTLQLVKHGYGVGADARLEYLLGPRPARQQTDGTILFTDPKVARALTDTGGFTIVRDECECAVLVSGDRHLAHGEVDFGSPLDLLVIGSGFYYPERSSGGTFRWSHGASSQVVLGLEPGRAHKVTVRAAPFVAPGRIQTISLSVNGIPQGTLTMSASPSDYSWDVPAQAIRAENTLEFSYGYVESPARTSGSADQRQLAVRFYSLMAIPTT